MADKPAGGLADVIAASAAVNDIDPDSEYIGARGLTRVPAGQR